MKKSPSSVTFIDTTAKLYLTFLVAAIQFGFPTNQGNFKKEGKNWRISNLDISGVCGLSKL